MYDNSKMTEDAVDVHLALRCCALPHTPQGHNLHQESV
jgi:hypothetical protein